MRSSRILRWRVKRIPPSGSGLLASGFRDVLAAGMIPVYRCRLGKNSMRRNLAPLALLLALTLKIVVVDSSHNPVVGARVSVRTSDGRRVPPDHLTAPRGNTEFKLAPGRYIVTALSPSANCGPGSLQSRGFCGAGSISVNTEGTEKE